MRERLAHLRIEDAGIVLLLIFFGVSGAIPGIAPNQASGMTGVPATHLQALVGIGTQAVVDLAILGLLLRNRELLGKKMALLGWPLALSIWAVASVCWSVDPLLTGRRALPLLLSAALGALLSLRLPPQRMLLLLQIAFVVLACWSAVLAVFFPGLGLDASTGHGGDWQGVFTQKNACGRAMVLAIALVLSWPKATRATAGRAAWQAALLVLFTAGLLLSGSRGAWLIGSTVVAALGALKASARCERRLRVSLLASVACLTAIAIPFSALSLAALAPALGRDASLTGRTAIWHQVWLAILSHPLLGYGFSAFWQGTAGPSWRVVLALRFMLFHAHNGFLEIWLELGLAGLLLFTACFVRACILLWPELREGHVAEAAWLAAVLLLVVLYDLDENTLLSFNGLFWVLYTAALVRIEHLAAERRAVATALRIARTAAARHVAQPSATAAAWQLLPGARRSPWYNSPAGKRPWL